MVWSFSPIFTRNVIDSGVYVLRLTPRFNCLSIGRIKFGQKCLQSTVQSAYAMNFVRSVSENQNFMDRKRNDRYSDVSNVIDEKFRLHLEGKSPSQMVETLRSYRHLMDLIRFRTFIKQLSSIGPIFDFHLSPEQFEFLHEMFRSFPEMVTDLSNLSDLSKFIVSVRINSRIPVMQYITREVVKNIDDMSIDETFVLYKGLQSIRISAIPEGDSQLNLLNDDVIRARYLLASNIAFRIETMHFDETDIVSLCEIFRIINRELYAKEAIDILINSIVSMSCYMRSKNANEMLAGFTSSHGSRILKEVFNSGDKETIKRYTELINLLIRCKGRLTNSLNDQATTQGDGFISDCFIRMLLKEGENFSSISFWRNFLGEIDFNRHKLDIISWQNLLTLINRFRVYCPFIIDAFAPILMKNAESYIEDRRISPIPYIYLMAECYHKPLTVNWEKLVTVLLHPKKMMEIPIDRTLAVISRLAILDDYNSIKTFDIERVKWSLSSFRNHPQCKRLTTFYSGTMQESDDPVQKWSVRKELSPFVVRAIALLDKDIRIGPISPIQSILETAFGGPEFVLNGIWTRSGLFMSHLLVFRRGEYPVAIRNVDEKSDLKYSFLSDVSLPPEGKIVVVLPAYRYYYTNHSRNLRGKVQFKLRLMRKLGIIPVITDIDEFDGLHPHERTHWLVNKIRTKVMENNSDAWEFWR